MTKSPTQWRCLKWTEKSKGTIHVSYKRRGGGCLGEGGVDCHVYKNVKMKQKAGYQRHVFHCSNQAVRQ